MKRENPTLKQALNFRYEPVIRKLENKGFSTKEARSLFQDVKKFLWICATNPHKCFVPTEKIDVGWHCLLEFTHAYQEFCSKTLGRFVHHFPEEALPASFAGSRCCSCGGAAGRKIKLPIGISLRDQTLTVARASFGKISKNWNFDTSGKN